MKLSLEIPTAYLPEWFPLTDFGFALAHRVLEDEEYRDFYKNVTNAPIILDNSMHELGRPLSPEELERAASLLPDPIIIPPDLLGQPERNFRWYVEQRKVSKGPLAVVMSGNTPKERAEFLEGIRYCHILCLPYRENRVRWYLENRSLIEHLWGPGRIHLLGVNTLTEFSDWDAYGIDTRDWSIDTRKPIKLGVHKVRMSETESLRGRHIAGPDSIFGARNLSCAQIETCLWNISYLRKFTR